MTSDSDNMDRIVSFCSGRTSAAMKTLLFLIYGESQTAYLGKYRNVWSIIYSAARVFSENALSVGFDRGQILCIVF